MRLTWRSARSARRRRGADPLLSLLGRSNSRRIFKLTQLGNSDFEKLSNFIAFRAVVLPRCYLSDLAPAAFSPRGVPPTPVTAYPEVFAINGAHRVVARAILSLPHYQVDCKRGAVAVYSAKTASLAWSVDITDLSSDTSNDLRYQRHSLGASAAQPEGGGRSH